MKILISIVFISFITFSNVLAGSDHSGNREKKSSKKIIAGKVVNQFGEPVPGAKVEAETGEYAFTDFDGNYKLCITLSPKESTIQIHSVGYLPVKIKSSEISLFSSFSLKEI